MTYVSQLAVYLISFLGIVISSNPAISGDFGRADRGVWERQIWPKLGSVSAWLRESPKSGLDITDQERALRQQIHFLLAGPHHGQWFLTRSARLQRHDVIPPADHTFGVNSYYAHLRSAQDLSQSARYRRLQHHIARDVHLVSALIPVIEAVQMVDMLRVENMASVSASAQIAVNPNPYLLEHNGRFMPRNIYTAVTRRMEENQTLTAWLGRAMSFRAASYHHALTYLDLETPDEALSATTKGELQRFDTLVSDIDRMLETGGKLPSLKRSDVERSSRYRRSDPIPGGDVSIPQK